MIDALRVTVDPDRPAPVPARHPGEEWLYVLSGTLRLEYDGEIHLLERGHGRPLQRRGAPPARRRRVGPPRYCSWRPSPFATFTPIH